MTSRTWPWMKSIRRGRERVRDRERPGSSENQATDDTALSWPAYLASSRWVVCRVSVQNVSALPKWFGLGFFFSRGRTKVLCNENLLTLQPRKRHNVVVVFPVIWCARNLKKFLGNTGPLKATTWKTIPEGPRTNYFNFFFRWVRCPGINSV